MDNLQDRLELDSRLTEVARVRSRVDKLTDRLGFPDENRFAVQLCMEEALANMILHGYRNEPGHPIVVTALVQAGTLSIRIDDQAHPSPSSSSCLDR